jgi:AbrB family looped-hinge helix DNA binding protein
MDKPLFPKILGTATLNEKGQLVIPVEARNSLGLSAGSKVVIMSSPYRPALVLIKAEEVEAMVKDLANALHEDDDKSKKY